MANTYIDAEQLSAISVSLKTKGENILSAYRSDTMSALQLGRECLQISGVNLEDLFKALEDIYGKINGRLSELAEFLKNNVASSYEELAQALQANFNGEVGETLSSLLGIPLTKAAVVTSNPNITQNPQEGQQQVTTHNTQTNITSTSSNSTYKPSSSNVPHATTTSGTTYKPAVTSSATTVKPSVGNTSTASGPVTTTIKTNDPNRIVTSTVDGTNRTLTSTDLTTGEQTTISSSSIPGTSTTITNGDGSRTIITPTGGMTMKDGRLVQETTTTQYDSQGHMVFQTGPAKNPGTSTPTQPSGPVTTTIKTNDPNRIVTSTVDGTNRTLTSTDLTTGEQTTISSSSIPGTSTTITNGDGSRTIVTPTGGMTMKDGRLVQATTTTQYDSQGHMVFQTSPAPVSKPASTPTTYTNVVTGQTYTQSQMSTAKPITQQQAGTFKSSNGTTVHLNQVPAQVIMMQTSNAAR